MSRNATQTGTGGKVPSTGKSVNSDNAHVIQFDRAKISRSTKVWNDVHALRAFGWA